MRLKKVLLSHCPKTAGTHLISYFEHTLGYERIQSQSRGDTGVWNDYTNADLRLEISRAHGFLNTHSLSYGWHEMVPGVIPKASREEIVQTIRDFRSAGWFIFTFVRHPGDALCSFYHYVKDYEDKGMPEIIDAHTSVDMSIEGFLSLHCDKELFPTYWRELDYVGVAGNDGFKAFFEEYFDHEFVPNARGKHTSSNPGYRYYCERGEVSEETQARIEASLNMMCFNAVLERHNG